MRASPYATSESRNFHPDFVRRSRRHLLNGGHFPSTICPRSPSLSADGLGTSNVGIGGWKMRRIRFAFRSLAKAPLLSTVVVLSLGLGIGVNTAIFSLLHQVVLSKLQVPHPEQ